MSFALRMQRVATKLLRKFDESTGRLVLIKNSEPVWDDVLGEMVTPPPVEVPLTGITNEYSIGMINGTTIQSGDLQVIAEVIDISYGGITSADKVRIDGVVWSIVNRPQVDYTGITIAHKLQCRR